MTADYRVDPSRWDAYGEDGPTGIYVRAQDQNGKWVNADIITLDKPSLISWLRSRGGDNPWAESTVALLLGWRSD